MSSDQAARQAADELERLDAAMTAGPWVADCPRVNWRVRSGENYVMECGAQGVRQGEDAEAIAALRNRASSDAKLLRALAADVARLTRERDRLRAACELTLRRLRGEVIERSVRDAIAEALAQPGDGAAGGGRG
jgi:hypothetical protein